jgi:hypothetical protein
LVLRLPLTRKLSRCLYIAFFVRGKQELIWQGEGVGYLQTERTKKRINEFVCKI